MAPNCHSTKTPRYTGVPRQQRNAVCVCVNAAERHRSPPALTNQYNERREDVRSILLV